MLSLQMGKESKVNRCHALYKTVSEKITESRFLLFLKALRDTGNEHVARTLSIPSQDAQALLVLVTIFSFHLDSE